MTDADIRAELFGRIIVRLMQLGIVPDHVSQTMLAEFERNGSMMRGDDAKHMERLAFELRALIFRSGIDISTNAIADREAVEARRALRLVSTDGGNDPT
ncbi:hypothetical protein [Sphingomonas crocodyli]|uniref:Uncharacterized protein n=1 Tax=Sphingomonas crocodyli TaxID=1979270 RepID=A0A437M872_9SPHN|nr:hypothetical protein [Sphingomonas crocodyli]RVT93694.1 hypothetical protein EOD43_07455 [Sphingomonas crocodyli]